MISKDYTLKENIYTFKPKETFSKEINIFYNNEPFPNYAQDNKLTILNKGDTNYLANNIKKKIGLNKKILEVGCGTSQLANYFAIGTNNQVYAMDVTFESLRLGKNFAENNNISNISFINADLFDDVFLHNSFDLIWCSGVLHHTKKPKQGFKQIIKYLKKNGIVVIGLYNFYGRILTRIRRKIFNIFGKSIGTKFVMLFDPYLRSLNGSKDSKKIKAWIQDQYQHPHESLHSIDEVLQWFKEENIEFLNSIPGCNFESAEADLNIDEKDKGSFYQRLINQILMIFNNYGKEGGLFVLIGKKNESI
tara:strand:- start:9 stop:926 length:918 start_codon:yes stop_codon:yes gene_type:complete